ncbi:hypothetical protein BJX70DRAFT_362503 [Aspergillus crustosus]
MTAGQRLSDCPSITSISVQGSRGRINCVSLTLWCILIRGTRTSSRALVVFVLKKEQ